MRLSRSAQMIRPVLVIVDMQGELAKRVRNSESVLKQQIALVRAFQIFQRPIFFSEHLPDKLGPTHPALLAELEAANAQRIIKEQFAVQLKELERGTRTEVTEVVLCGAETHACVFQTAVNALQRDEIDVRVIVDATSSQNQIDHDTALQHLRDCGADLFTTQMMLFDYMSEWDLRNDEGFKEVLKVIKGEAPRIGGGGGVNEKN